MSDKLKPCPFCGGNMAIYEAVKNGWICLCNCMRLPRDGEYFTSKEGAIKGCNTRPEKSLSAWVSVKDRLPEDGVDVLCLHYHGSYLVAMHFEDESPPDIWHKNGGKVRDITHWQPIEPPEIKKEIEG